MLIMLVFTKDRISAKHESDSNFIDTIQQLNYKELYIEYHIQLFQSIYNGFIIDSDFNALA